MSTKAALQSPSALLSDHHHQHDQLENRSGHMGSMLVTNQHRTPPRHPPNDPPYDNESRKHGYHTTPPDKRYQPHLNVYNHQQETLSQTKREHIQRPPSLKDHRDQLNELFMVQEQLDKASKERNWFYEENSLLKYHLHVLQCRIHHAEALWHRWIQQQSALRRQDNGNRRLCTSTLLDNDNNDHTYIQPSTIMIQPTQPFFSYAAKTWQSPLYKTPVWQRRHKAP
jgi:hypothetical protein